MSAEAVQREILDPMQGLFLPPRNMDEGAQASALREYVNALQGFEAADLKSSWVTVRDAHATRGWPVPASFVLAARQARKDRVPAGAIRKDWTGKEKPTQDQIWARWLAIRASQLGHDAARRGVAWALRCAILTDGKEAHEINLAELVIAKAKAECTADAIDKGLPVEWRGRTFTLDSVNADAAMKMWRTLQVKEEETRMEIMAAGAA